MKRIVAVMTAALMAAVVLSGCQGMDYDKAKKLYEDGQYAEAATIFTELGDYESSEAYLKKCNWEITLQTYGDVISLLDQGTWYFNGGSDTMINSVSFSGDKATVSKAHFDGNGKQDDGHHTANFEIDDDSITVLVSEGTPLDIPYSVVGDAVSLGSGEYLTAEQIDADLQGYWCLRYTSALMGTPLEHEHNWYVNGGWLTYQDANEGLNLPSGEYYYSDPELYTYTIGFGELTTSSHDTDVMNTFFNIINGEAVLLRFDKVASRASDMPTVNGYSF